MLGLDTSFLESTTAFWKASLDMMGEVVGEERDLYQETRECGEELPGF